MRISDWISDLCSSELWRRWRCPPRQRPATTTVAIAATTAAATTTGIAVATTTETGTIAAPIATTAAIDRTSVVQGKRVEVRVDLGRRRIIKKINTSQPTHVTVIFSNHLNHYIY